MKKFILCCLAVLVIVFDAEAASLELIKQRALKTPQKVTGNVSTLTHYLIKPFEDEEDRVYVIAYWISLAYSI
ncbi:MAG: hypothetical protein ILA52_00925 [Alphaproteobacteria bacterium]|nr:hypothetical protein [Alphaproteobacteria bacterium]